VCLLTRVRARTVEMAGMFVWWVPGWTVHEGEGGGKGIPVCVSILLAILELSSTQIPA
jgi:hypothetical protein